ncbi:DNA polymerase III subunit delta [uncultured Gammaproteobacteria bacterium]
MKLQGRAIEAFLRKPDSKIRAVLVYGPDAGLVRERAEQLGRQLVPDANDPFRIADFSPRCLISDPARLGDEAAALSFTGGRRLIRIRDGDDPLTSVFAALFRSPPLGDSLIVVEAGELGARSKLRLLFEGAEIGAAIPCYVEDEGSLGQVVASMLSAHGLAIDPDAQAWLAGNLVGDRLVARSEIGKLALYMGDEKRVTLDHVQACIGDSASLSLDEPAWAASGGDFADLDRALARLFGEGQSVVAILRAAQRHFQRLHLVSSQVAAGASAEVAVGALKPPVFFKQKPLFVAQIRRWSPVMLAQAMDRLTETEAECKRTHAPDQTLCARVLFQLAALGRPRPNRR